MGAWTEMLVNLGGVTPLSTVDWTGTPSLVVFFRGCPLRCPHCHNKELQQGENLVNLSIVDGELKVFGENRMPLPSKQITLESALLWASSKPSEPFISGIVISGGEPLMQPDALQALARRSVAITLAPCSALTPKYENKRLLAIKLADPVPGRRIGLAWRRGFTRPEVIQVIRDAVHELKVPGLRMIAG